VEAIISVAGEAASKGNVSVKDNLDVMEERKPGWQ